jgi:hypothetical protein
VCVFVFQLLQHILLLVRPCRLLCTHATMRLECAASLLRRAV